MYPPEGGKSRIKFLGAGSPSLRHRFADRCERSRPKVGKSGDGVTAIPVPLNEGPGAVIPRKSVRNGEQS